jgi:hypothetical protein
VRIDSLRFAQMLIESMAVLGRDGYRFESADAGGVRADHAARFPFSHSFGALVATQNMAEYKQFRRPRQAHGGSWWISDIYAAAYLHSRGHEVLGLEQSGGTNRLVFIFAASDSFEANYAAFERDVSLARFLKSLHTMKSLLKDSGAFFPNQK